MGRGKQQFFKQSPLLLYLVGKLLQKVITISTKILTVTSDKYCSTVPIYSIHPTPPFLLTYLQYSPTHAKLHSIIRVLSSPFAPYSKCSLKSCVLQPLNMKIQDCFTLTWHVHSMGCFKVQRSFQALTQG